MSRNEGPWASPDRPPLLTGPEPPPRETAGSSNVLSVAIVSALLAPRFGGPAEVARLHRDALAGHAQVGVFGTIDPKDELAVRSTFPEAQLFSRHMPNRWFYASGLAARLNDLPHTSSRVVHAHMAWDYPVYAAWRASRALRGRLFITPHGSLLNPRRTEGLKKRIYGRLFLRRMLDEADGVHVLNSEEAQGCVDYGVRAPIHIIPNALPVSRFERPQDRAAAPRHWPELRDRKVILYMGRIWSGKGLDILLSAWAAISGASRDDDWALVIAGPDYRGYANTLKRRVEQLGGSRRVHFLGPVYGQQKLDLLDFAKVFVLPSYGEAFSMSLLEAAAARLPMIFTTACNATEFARANAAWEVETKEPSLRQALAAAVGASDTTLEAMGAAAWTHARERYSMEIVSRRLIRMYRGEP